MDSLLAIGVGLGLRILLDALTDNDDRVSGVLVGMWEGVVLNHFIRRIPRSFDPYLGFGFRIFVDFLFTQSLSRLALVALWSLVGMLLADVAPNLWRDSGLRRLYRQVRKDVRRVERAVPRIRIKNDLPSMRLFNRSRMASSSSSSQASSSVRSDRAAPSRSPVPSPAPATSPARRPGRTPPGTFPNVSGWSETGTDVSSLRLRVEDVVTHPGPSPSLIPSQEFATYGRTDATHLSTSQTRTTTVQGTTIMQIQTQKNESVVRKTVVETATTVAAAAASMSVEPIEDASRHNPPTIPDDWVDVDHPPSTQANEPVAAFQPDPESTPEPHPPTPSRPISIVVPPPAVDSIPDIPDVGHCNKSRPPDEIPLPESRAASVIGGVYDQPQSRSASRDPSRSRLDKASSELGVDLKSLAPFAMQSTRSQTTSRAASRVGSRLKQSVEVDVPDVPPKEPAGEPDSQGRPQQTGPVHSMEPIIVLPPAVNTNPDVDHGNKASRPPELISLPESRAASVIGGVYDQPQSRSAWRDPSRSRLDKATSELGVDPKSLVPFAMQPTQSQTTSRASSRVGSRLKQSIDVDPPKEPAGEPVSQGRPQQTGPVHSIEPIVVPPPAVNTNPDVDHGNQASRPPEQISLPESRAASVIGGVYDQPQCRSAWRDPSHSRLDRATSEIGVDPKSLAPFAMEPTQSQTTSRAPSRVGSRLKQSIEVDVPTVPLKEPVGEPVSQGKPQQTGPVHSMEPTIVPPPAVNTNPDVDHGNKASRPPDQMPLPESRAASVIGGVYDQPQCRSAWRDPSRSRLDRATSEIGVDPKSLAPFAIQSTRSQMTSRAPSRAGSRLKQSIDVDVPTVPPKEPAGGPVSQGRSTEPPMITTPAQVDPPASILSQSGDADTPPLLFATSPRDLGKTQISLGDLTLGDDAGRLATEGGANKKDNAGHDKDSLFDLLPPNCTPPPPFSEFDGVPEGFAAGEAPTEDDPVMQDEGPTELTEEQKAIEEKRLAFLSLQVQELEGSRVSLQNRLEKDDSGGKRAKELESDLEDSEKTLSVVTERLKKKKFSGTSSDPAIPEITLTGKSLSEVQSLLTSAVMDMLLARDDAGPMTVQFTINRSKPLKGNARALKDTVTAFAKRHKFASRSEPATPGIINVTF